MEKKWPKIALSRTCTLPPAASCARCDRKSAAKNDQTSPEQEEIRRECDRKEAKRRPTRGHKQRPKVHSSYRASALAVKSIWSSSMPCFSANSFTTSIGMSPRANQMSSATPPSAVGNTQVTAATRDSVGRDRAMI